jgi:tRNA(fMet)-specific endonuclease VapC
MLVVDTNALIYFFKGQGCVAEHLLNHPPADVGVPAIVLFELETGIAKSLQPDKRRGQLAQLLDVVTVLPFGAAEARIAGQLRATLESLGTPVGQLDTMIAATALVAGSPLVTRNVREFSRVPGLTVVDWYSTPPLTPQ